ncbi:MAG TPA: mechanosensitive ion channel [Alphaproteobacteria bacterium]|nr:mechanosensitive ion channel [Alphaproteobacteria bacterium]
MTIIKPQGLHAKALLFIVLAAILWLWSQGHFSEAKEYLDTPQLTFQVGNFKVSLYTALKGLLSIIVIFWTAAIVSEFAEKRIKKMRKIRAANKALFQKIFQIIIYFVAFLVTLNALGIDLTSLTVLSGAVGIGLGFGLQKIAANFVSGMILVLERALKPDDLVELEDGTFGYVRKSSSRSTLLETLDGKEIIVPNEDFITKRVTNWTLTSNKARIDIPFGVSYNSDIEKARDLALEAAKNHPRCMKEPEPVCFLRNFGDSSVDFIIMFWVEDVTQGRWNAQSEVMFDLWHKFKEHKIEIPFPQRDLHLKTELPLQFTTKDKKVAKDD